MTIRTLLRIGLTTGAAIGFFAAALIGARGGL